MTATLESKLQPLARQACAEHGLALVVCRLTGGGKYLTVQVMAENPDGSGPLLDDCAKVSRALAAALDELDLIAGRYTLEVTSPGLDRPLFTAADYTRFVGRNAHVKFTRPQPVGAQSLGAVDGLIHSATADTVMLTIGDATQSFPMGAIRAAELAPTAAEYAALLKASAGKPKSPNN